MSKRTMYILFVLLGILIIWFLYSWFSVRNIEEPKFSVEKSADGYEIRKYEPYIVAETTITDAKSRDKAARDGFPIIAGYIFGGNTKKDKIAMTAPVNTEESYSEKIAMTVPVNTESEGGEGSYKISFVMPSKYTLDTLPEPDDSRVILREVPGRRVAVRRFSWSNNEATFKKNEDKLLESVGRDGLEAIGSVNVARYNPPWTIPFMLRSEVQIEVK